MKRRGFLGLLGLAPVAGPAMAAEAARSTVAQSSGVAIGHSPFDTFRQSPEYMQLVKRSLKLDARRYGRIKVDHGLDPDIAVLRSVPLTTKIRMQIEREAALDREQTLVDRAIEAMQNRMLPNWAGGQTGVTPRWFHAAREDD